MPETKSKDAIATTATLVEAMNTLETIQSSSSTPEAVAGLLSSLGESASTLLKLLDGSPKVKD